jgi:hypothetical protein
MTKTIENGIPIPPISNKTNSRHEFHLIKEGQSCLYTGTKKELETIRTCAISYGKRHKINIVTRQTENGLRVWHVAETKPEHVTTTKKEAWMLP